MKPSIPFRLLLCSLLFLGACTSMPPDIRNFAATDIPYQLINQSIDTYKNAPIRWGGTVIEVENEADSSLMQVLFYPLDRNAYPQTNKLGEGRFAVETSEFLDPAIFVKGAEVTITGSVKGSIERTVGNKTIHIPLITAKAIHLWSQAYREDNMYWNSRYRYGPYPGYYGYPSFYNGYYRPYRLWW
ncbi:Slp family lipoprotein [Nitrosomonas eutropha]|uniref:Slp family lipoprotein n=1 Tax=Nitrosomonas eutropha TaxID=916 RepID=UPI0008BB23D3|nr:Slp family lipoprotein [Nitrosomonas eutropha]SEI38307.1 outer membrane lipoprotein [Nitrosomonas eutropha]